MAAGWTGAFAEALAEVFAGAGVAFSTTGVTFFDFSEAGTLGAGEALAAFLGGTALTLGETEGLVNGFADLDADLEGLAGLADFEIAIGLAIGLVTALALFLATILGFVKDFEATFRAGLAAGLATGLVADFKATLLTAFGVGFAFCEIAGFCPFTTGFPAALPAVFTTPLSTALPTPLPTVLAAAFTALPLAMLLPADVFNSVLLTNAATAAHVRPTNRCSNYSQPGTPISARIVAFLRSCRHFAQFTRAKAGLVR